jgi:hypothetical protein
MKMNGNINLSWCRIEDLGIRRIESRYSTPYRRLYHITVYNVLVYRIGSAAPAPAFTYYSLPLGAVGVAAQRYATLAALLAARHGDGAHRDGE